MSWFDAHTISWSSPGLCWLHQYSATSSISFRVCSVIVAVANPHCLLPSCCHPLAGMNCAELRLRCPELGRCNKRTTSVAAPPASLCGEVAPWPCRTQRSRCGLPVAFPKTCASFASKGIIIYASSYSSPRYSPGMARGQQCGWNSQQYGHSLQYRHSHVYVYATPHTPSHRPTRLDHPLILLLILRLLRPIS